jgi:hypothetical protein
MCNPFCEITVTLLFQGMFKYKQVINASKECANQYAVAQNPILVINVIFVLEKGMNAL